jgi:uncharacterized membrane protein YeiB
MNLFPLPGAVAAGRRMETWWLMRVLFEGSQRRLFSLPFGAGMRLMVSRLEASGAARPGRIYYRRLLWLLAFGLFDAFLLLWPADILVAYALMGFCSTRCASLGCAGCCCSRWPYLHCRPGCA